MRIPAQRADDRTSKRSDTGSQQDVTDDATRAGAEEAIAGLVGLFLLVFLMVVVVVFMWVVVIGLLLLLLWGRVGILLRGVAVGLVGRRLVIRRVLRVGL